MFISLRLYSWLCLPMLSRAFPIICRSEDSGEIGLFGACILELLMYLGRVAWLVFGFEAILDENAV